MQSLPRSGRRASLPFSRRQFSLVLPIGEPDSDKSGHGFGIILRLLDDAFANQIHFLVAAAQVSSDMQSVPASHLIALRAASQSWVFGYCLSGATAGWKPGNRQETNSEYRLLNGPQK